MSAVDPTLVVRPRRLTRVCRVVAVVVVAAFAGVSLALRSGQGAEQFRTADQVAMFVLGLLLAGAVLAFTRTRVVADGAGVRVRNILSEKVVPWQVVVAVRLDEGSPWATLDLRDDDQLGMLALQANDGQATVDAVLALRRLLQQSRLPPAGQGR